MNSTPTESRFVIAPYLSPGYDIRFEADGIAVHDIPKPSIAIQANSYYFGHPEWAQKYFEACHRDDHFTSRWRAAIGNWDNQIVVDIGCGPGNLYASLGGSPQTLIGVDVSLGALQMAQSLGYTPLLADAHNLPLSSGFADVVALNATLHHCDDMAQVLAEAARLVRPGGILVTDHDPQYTAWNFKGLALGLWQMRLPLYRFLKRGGHATAEEQRWGLAGEAHHKPGDGMIPDLYYQTLNPMGFTVKLHPHNHTVGAEALQGNYGCSSLKYRCGQRLSGLDPDTPEAALSLMCIAKRGH
ncbi:MAG: class I SAM-dependent methyltransferase [Cyanothece sp. SIO1E1]|nr:class I SAM-dependent methyltransferase [Cyanothece sp. SIO1E1]